MKQRFIPLFLLAGISTAYADGNSAMTFAAQAGSIAGAAQACGQDVSEFNNRVNQALAILADTTSQITSNPSLSNLRTDCRPKTSTNWSDTLRASYQRLQWYAYHATRL